MTFREALARLRSLARKSRLEQELADEIASHLEQAEQEFCERGMTPKEARRAARRSFGGVEQVKERYRDQRGVPWLETLWRDVRYGVWGLVKSPGFTAIAVCSLALGIGANTAVFSVFHAALLKPLPYHEPDRVVRIWETFRHPEGQGTGSISTPNLEDWRAQSKLFESIASCDHAFRFTLTDGDRPVMLLGDRVEPEMFELLGARPMLGRYLMPGENSAGKDNVVVLSYGLWKDRYVGDPGIVGREIAVNGLAHTVLGVMPREFHFHPYRRSQLWKPLTYSERQLGARGSHWMYVLGRLAPGVEREQAEAELKTIAAGLAEQYPEAQEGRSVTTQPLSESLIGDRRELLLTLLMAVGGVLLIACANVANLLLGRATARRREFAMRTALGAARSRLIFQGLTEGCILGAAGGAAGLLLGWLAIGWLGSTTGSGFWSSVRPEIDLPVMIFCLGVALVAAISSSLIPALRASGVDPQGELKAGGAAVLGLGRERLRGALVVVQVALTLVVLISASLLQQSFERLVQVDTGVQPDQALTFRAQTAAAKYPSTEERRRLYEGLIEGVRAIPGVEAVGLTSTIPFRSWGYNGRFLIGGRPVPSYSQMPISEFRTVSPGYFQAMGIPLLAGRMLEETDRDSTPNAALINQELARRHFEGEDPVGQRITVGDPDTEEGWATIVGVVGNVRGGGLNKGLDSMVYGSFLQSPNTPNKVVLRTSRDPESVVAEVRAVVRTLDPELPVSEVALMTDVIRSSAGGRRFHAMLFSVFAGLALVLGLGGVYGVIAYAVSRRTHEIGLRAALGARSSEILRMVIAQGLALAGAGAMVGLAGAWAYSGYLESQLFAIEATDPVTYLAATAALLGMAAVACWLPARRAASVDPMRALRQE